MVCAVPARSLVVELAPLADADLRALLDDHTDGSAPAAALDAIVARAAGNPFFAEELLAAAEEPGERLPRGVRDLLLRRLRPARPVHPRRTAAGRDGGR